MRGSKILNEINKIQEYAPMYSYRKVTHELKHQGFRVNLKQIQRVMQKNGLKALQPKKIRNLSKNPKRGKEHFLLKDVKTTINLRF